MQPLDVMGEMLVQPLLILLARHSQRVAGASADDQMNVIKDAGIVVPGGKSQQRILAYDKRQRPSRTLLLAPLAQGLRRI